MLKESIFELPPAGLDSSSLEMALVLQSHPSPHGSPGLPILQSGCPSAPGLFLPGVMAPASDVLEHRALVNSILWLLSRPGRVSPAVGQGS